MHIQRPLYDRAAPRLLRNNLTRMQARRRACCQSYTTRRNDQLSNPVMAGLVPAILTRTEFAKDAIPDSKHSMEMVGLRPAMTGLAARAVHQYQWRLVVRRETGKE